jgi:hypothetical protein
MSIETPREQVFSFFRRVHEKREVAAPYPPIPIRLRRKQHAAVVRLRVRVPGGLEYRTFRAPPNYWPSPCPTT